LTRRLRLEGRFDFDAVAAKTPGFVGADLAALTKEAAAAAVSRIFADMQRDGEVPSPATPSLCCAVLSGSKPLSQAEKWRPMQSCASCRDAAQRAGCQAAACHFAQPLGSRTLFMPSAATRYEFE
jgi:SpoVK/Ycf46/Vps4 family AAA+-type ATPase